MIYVNVCVMFFGTRPACISTFLGAFAKLQIATVNLIMCARLSDRPHVTARLPLGGFSCHLSSFRKMFRENSSFIKI